MAEAAMIRVADLVVRRLSEWGLDTCFSVTGGGAMHLNDAFGRSPDFDVHYLHHEQSCAMAAEGYARLTGKPAVLNVTSGPGVLNAMNGVFGAFTDSIPMVVVSGQVRVSTLADSYGLDELRQLGDQELRTTAVVRDVVKTVSQLVHPDATLRVVDEAVAMATSGRPGPVWLDIPVDVQGALVPDPGSPSLPPEVEPSPLSSEAAEVLTLLRSADRPLILAGTGVRIAGAADELVRFAEAEQIPVATAWSHDVFPNDHYLYAGRPGTIGTRAGNFILQACDLLLVVGSRLNIRQTSYNFTALAPHARIVWIDIDPAELAKPFIKPTLPIVADARAFLLDLLGEVEADEGCSAVDARRTQWLDWCSGVRSRFEPRFSDYTAFDRGINPYHFVMRLSDSVAPNTIMVCGNASACIIPFQVHQVPPGGRLFSNSGSASMGYDLPAAIGAAIAEPDLPIICMAGDGSLMMNLQELQSLSCLKADLLLVILANDGYLSIRQTQSNFFGVEHGCSSTSGLTFPDFARVCEAFGLPTWTLDSGEDWESRLLDAMRSSGPRVVVANLEPSQEFEPRLKSRMVDGEIRTPELDDMFPHLPQEVLAEVRASAGANETLEAGARTRELSG